MNQGILAAAGDYILMISAHCYPVHDNWIAEMTRPFVDPKVALVYGKQEGNEVSRYSETRLMKQWFPSTSFSRQKSPFCNNANSAIPKKLWEEMKYNEELTGLEDLDWAQKTIEKGFHLYYNADASIIHVHEEGFKQIYNRYRREAITLKQIYKEASFSLWDFVSLSAANISSDLMAAKSERAFLKFFSEIFLFRLCQFWGTFQGYRLSKNISPDLRERFYYPPSRD